MDRRRYHPFHKTLCNMCMNMRAKNKISKLINLRLAPLAEHYFHIGIFLLGRAWKEIDFIEYTSLNLCSYRRKQNKKWCIRLLIYNAEKWFKKDTYFKVMLDFFLLFFLSKYWLREELATHIYTNPLNNFLPLFSVPYTE